MGVKVAVLVGVNEGVEVYESIIITAVEPKEAAAFPTSPRAMARGIIAAGILSLSHEFGSDR